MKQMIKASLMFLTALSLFVTVVFAWFTISSQNYINPVNVSVIERDLQLDVEYGINGGAYESFENEAEINAFLDAMIPGDFINIKVVVQNKNTLSSPDLSFDIILTNIRASVTDIEYDLTDFFFIENGTIKLTWYVSASAYFANDPYLIDEITLDIIDDTDILYLGYNLIEYRLNNLFDYEIIDDEIVKTNDITIFNTTIQSQHVVVIEFSIGLDPYTPSKGLGIQNGELLIDGLYSMFDE
jgi:hypothetical protein